MNSSIDSIKLNGCGLLILMSFILPGVYLYYKVIWDPSIPFLPRKSGAEWICYKDPSSRMIRKNDHTNQTTHFRRTFYLEKVSQDAKIEIRAFTHFHLQINGKLLKRIQTSTNWKELFSVPVASVLNEGKNIVEIMVTNKRGPQVLWAVLYNAPISIGSDSSWEVETDSKPSVPAALVTSQSGHPDNHSIESLKKAHGQVWARAILFFMVGSLLYWFWERRRTKGDTPISNDKLLIIITISAIIVWSLFFVNNNLRYPYLAGFDVLEHVYYVQLIINNRSLPLAADGWSTYNPPLFYMASACLEMLAPRQMTIKLKIIPFLAGLGNVLLAYILSKNIRHKYFHKQPLIVFFAAIAPLNIYLSHFFTNEGLAGFLMSALLVATVILLDSPIKKQKNFVWMGVLSGAALLTRYTSIVLFICICLVIILKITTSSDWPRKRGFTSLLLFMGTTAGIAGWYYLRNYLELGIWFPENWDDSLGYTWWQDPGVHTAGYYTQFGEVFSNPFFIGLKSFFDALYATFWGDTLASGAIVLDQGIPWHLEYMHSIMVLSIPATLMIMIGFFQASRKAIYEDTGIWCANSSFKCNTVYVAVITKKHLVWRCIIH